MDIVDKIILKSDILEVTKIKRKTKAKMFENLIAGSKLKFIVPIEYAGRNHGTYATYITIKNIDTGEKTTSSFNQITRILDAFEFKYFRGK